MNHNELEAAAKVKADRVRGFTLDAREASRRARRILMRVKTCRLWQGFVACAECDVEVAATAYDNEGGEGRENAIDECANQAAYEGWRYDEKARKVFCANCWEAKEVKDGPKE